jgi:hypothetical protein
MSLLSPALPRLVPSQAEQLAMLEELFSGWEAMDARAASSPSATSEPEGSRLDNGPKQFFSSNKKSLGKHPSPFGRLEGRIAPLGTIPASPGLVADEQWVSRSKRQSEREQSHMLRAFLRQHSRIENQKHCGRALIQGAKTVAVRVYGEGAGRTASITQLQSCKQKSCPVCAKKLAESRRVELRAAIDTWTARGGFLMMATFTARSRHGNDPAAMWEGISAGASRVFSGKAWAAEREKYGVAGYVRVVETTCHPSLKKGWARPRTHIHTHVLLFIDGGAQVPVAEWKARMERRWLSGIRSKGLGGSEKGQDLRVWDKKRTAFADYFTKQGIAQHGRPQVTSADKAAAEFAYGTVRKGMGLAGKNKKGVSPFVVLRDAMAGDASALAYYLELEEAQRARQGLLYSAGLKARLGLSEPDQSESAEDVGGAEPAVVTDVCFLDRRTWRQVASVPARVPALLNIAENSDVAAVFSLVASWGLHAFESATEAEYFGETGALETSMAGFRYSG